MACEPSQRPHGFSDCRLLLERAATHRAEDVELSAGEDVGCGCVWRRAGSRPDPEDLDGDGQVDGRNEGVAGDGDIVLSAGNRNMKGRMGSKNAQIYLTSPAVVAASAIRGEITDPREVGTY